MEPIEANPVDDEVIGAPEEATERAIDPAQDQEWLRAAAVVAGRGEVPEGDLPELIELELARLRESRDQE
ncbi:MAG TPA: hypothetical protein VGK53_06555 [Propionicimonas sp.]|jgi:hypothetical protein